MSGAFVIRPAVETDIPAILLIYGTARQYMRKMGNPHQWNGAYPGEKEVRADIASGVGRVVLFDGQIAGVFAFFLGEEPTYKTVYGGAWEHTGKYGFIHRIASAGTVGGVTKAAFDYALGFTDCLRIDTHRDNQPMQNALARYGFSYRGIIHLQSGDERLAFEFIKK